MESKGKKVVEESEHLRMGAAISFAVIILVIGIPLWWKTTEVYRVPLPNDRIEALKYFDYRISVNISLSLIDDSNSHFVINELNNILLNLKVFSVNFLKVNFNSDNKTVSDLESKHEIHPKFPGDILLMEVNETLNGNEIIVGNHRTIYFTISSVHNVGFVLKEWILQDDDLKETVMSVLTHKSTDVITRSKRQERRVRASSSYDIIFTTISPQPEKVRILYDQEDAVVRFFTPLTSQLDLVADHKLKSQWLYFIDLGQHPKRNGKDNFIMTSDQLPHIISPLEKKLGSGVSKHPCLHFIIYTALCEESSLHFRTHDGSLVNAVLSPRWGGIQVLNPKPEHCNSSQELIPDVSSFMSTFLAQLRSLIGIADQEYGIPRSTVLPLKSVKLRLWELDFLYRLRSLEQISLAQMTLQSLSQLLEEISNIVINEEVGASVNNAVDHIENGQKDLHRGNITGALYHARHAFNSAENAFTHPSLLALLYFPDDQKYAVYIPLFIPIMIPVLLSIRSIQSWKKFSFKRKTD